MTPKGLARDQCCNWVNGVCVGTGFKALPNGELRHFLLVEDDQRLEGQPCRVGRNKRCTFFERSVLPMAESPGEIAARTSYVSKFPVDRFSGHDRYCQCGEPIAKGRRMCDECRDKRRRETYRRNRRNERGPRNS